MSGFGSGSLFGQQGNAQGNNSFGNQAQAPANNSFGFGANRAQSFNASSPAAPKPFGFSGGSQAPTLFGQNNASNQQLNQGASTGLFGGASSSTNNTGGGGLFGNNSNPTPGPSTGLFGSNANSNQAPSTGLFGNNSTANPAPSTGLFGSANPSSSTGGTNTGLFGSNSAANPANPAPAAGSLFGNTQNTNQSATGNAGGLFGSNNAGLNKPAGGFNFGSSNNTANNNTGSGFGAPATKPLFGSSLTNTSNNSNPSGGGGLFGNTASSAQPGSASGGFGAASNNNTSGGLFGSNKPASTLGNPPATSLFGQSQQTQQQQPQQQQTPQQQLQTGVDQASYMLPGVTPSQKLYSSLSVQNNKRDHEDSEQVTFESKPPVFRRQLALPGRKQPYAGTSRLDGLPNTASAPPAGSEVESTALVASGAPVASTTAQGEPRKWINSYEKFVRDRPTTLTIKKTDRKPVLALLTGPETAPVAAEPPSIGSNLSGNASVSFNPAAESSMRDDRDDGFINEAEVSMFHRQANNMTLVRVNRQAIEEGYYISPRLEDLAAMSKQQLSNVEHLVIGREGFGKIEYPEPIDLSRISNLGDILGVFVIFGPGTVCVYPEEGPKAARGSELNMPCIVSIENAWPRDSNTHQVIKDVDDPRMFKHVQRLRKACESRGGEFVTFTQGIWVFKVPHFSTWGLPTNEMLVGEDDIDEPVLVADPNTVDGDMGEMAVEEEEEEEIAAPQLTSSPISPVVDSIQNDELLDDVKIEDEEADIMSDAAISESELPQTWQEQLTHASNGVLLAAAASLTAAAEPTSKLDLEDILDPFWKNSGRQSLEQNQEVKDAKDASNSAAFNAKSSSSQLNTLRLTIKRNPRTDSILPYLHTAVTFQEIYSMMDTRKSLWKLLAILYDNNDSQSGEEVDVERLSSWLDEEVQYLVKAPQGTALDKIWQLVTCHELDEAYKLAVKSNNVHLGLLLSLLGEKTSKETLKKDAEQQLRSWEMSHALNSIPTSVLRIWEIAAGKVPHHVRGDWKQWVGLHFWYFGETSLRNAMQTLPRTYATLKDPQLSFLEFFASKKQLRTAVNELDLMEAFYCLQAMITNRPGVVTADYKCLDNVCAKLANEFDEAGDVISAVYVALHIHDSKVTTKLLRNILQKGSTHITLPAEFGVPEEFLDESRANQVARQGEFISQAEYLVRAGLFNEAHKVIISDAGPDAVLSGNIAQLTDVLESLEKVSGEVKRWDFGGNVYLTYARFLHETPDQYTVVALCNSLRYIDTPNLKSEKAVSEIAKWVASTPTAKTTLTSQMVLKMKFDQSQLRIQTLQEASRLLN